MAEIAVELNAAICAVWKDSPHVLTVPSSSHNDIAALPSGPFEPAVDRTIERGVRRWVREQTALDLGYVEQLYTFGDRYRDPRERAGGPRVLSLGYLALVRIAPEDISRKAGAWRDWYDFFPWEDWRAGKPAVLERLIRPRLTSWCRNSSSKTEQTERRERVEISFGFSRKTWNRDAALERYELLYEAGLVAEAEDAGSSGDFGEPMALDHRRILATAMSRLRGKITYRPMIFELVPPTFRLSDLQRTAEALAGVRLHTANFRRLV
ncbi:MAG: NUDIX hydrolase [Vulcanimicrobiaceae bacterium]